MSPPLFAQAALYVYAMVKNDTAGIAASSGLSSLELQSAVQTFLREAWSTAHASVRYIYDQRTALVAAGGAGSADSSLEGRLAFTMHPWESLMPTAPTWSWAAAQANVTSAACAREAPAPAEWVHASPAFDTSMWQEEYCLLRCAQRHAFDAAAVLAACPAAGATVPDNALFLQELQAVEVMAAELLEEDEVLRELEVWQTQVTRGIQFAQSGHTPLPHPPGHSSSTGFLTSLAFFFDAVALTGVDVWALQPASLTLQRALLQSSGAAGLRIAPNVPAAASALAGGGDDVPGTDTWPQQVASVLLSGAFVAPPFPPSLSRYSTPLDDAPRGYAGQPLTFNSTHLAQGPVWLRMVWLLSTAASKAPLQGVTAALQLSAARLVCNGTRGTLAPRSTLDPVSEVYSGDTGAPLRVPMYGPDAIAGAAIAAVVLNPAPPDVVPPRRPAPIVGLAIAVAAELIFVMAVGAGCIAVGIRFMRDVTTGDRATLDMVAHMNYLEAQRAAAAAAAAAPASALASPAPAPTATHLHPGDHGGDGGDVSEDGDYMPRSARASGGEPGRSEPSGHTGGGVSGWVGSLFSGGGGGQQSRAGRGSRSTSVESSGHASQQVRAW